MIAIFTTKTLHHMFFVNEIYKNYKNILCIAEKKKKKPNFKTKVNFEKKRDIYEKSIWFKNSNPKFNSKIQYYYDINSSEILRLLNKNNIKYILIFGTSKIDLKKFKKYKNKIFNFHGGNPEKYRGLDSHYWSLYHNDLNSIETCLHEVKEKLDTGKILFKQKIKINSNTKIYELRKLNTDLCVKFAYKLIKIINNKKKIKLKKQKFLGRYYSFMPSVLKKNLKIKL
jgi:methionyl-tRNA formyltransferase